MSKFSASDAAFSGFRLVRENLRSVSVWMLIMTVTSVISSIVMIHFFGKELDTFSASMPAPGAEPNPDDLRKGLQAMIPTLLVSLPYMLLVNGVVYAGVNRLIQRPHDKGFAHLRLGMDEVRQGAVWLMYNLVLFVVFTGGSIVSEMLTTAGGPAGALVALLVFVGMIWAAIYLAVRLSLATAATFETGRIVFFKSMPITKGQFWPMVGAYFLAAVMCVIVFLLLMAVVGGVAALISGSIETSAKLMRADTSSLKVFLTPIGMAQALLSGVLSVLTSLIIFTPGPTMYLALKGDSEAPPASNGNW
jgi:hypothetical protein